MDEKTKKELTTSTVVRNVLKWAVKHKYQYLLNCLH